MKVKHVVGIISIIIITTLNIIYIINFIHNNYTYFVSMCITFSAIFGVICIALTSIWIEKNWNKEIFKKK